VSKFLRLPDVMAATGLGRSSIYAFVREKNFPAPIKLGPRASAWDGDEVAAWMDERKSERDARAASDV